MPSASPRRRRSAGTVYLLHFSEPYVSAAWPGAPLGVPRPPGWEPRRRVQHYLGYAKSLRKRLERHRAGDGAQLLRVIVEKGIGFECVRTWPGNRALEKRLKSMRSHKNLCPRCVGADVAARRGRFAVQASA